MKLNGNQYKCKYGLYHDKKVINGEPSSNNGWIYTAYGLKLFGEVYIESNTFNECYQSTQDFMRIDRLPNKRTPPLSIDEVIGMVSLGVLNADMLEAYDWYMYGDIRAYKKIRWIDSIKEAWRCRKQHRNYWWKRNNIKMAKLACKIMPWHKAYIKGKPNLWFALHVIFTAMGNNTSAKNLCLLMCEDLNSPLKYLFNKKKQYADYFEDGHIFRESLEN